ncbi:glutathione S-transferase Gst2 [Schizosaccharomyces cryophilus OY26]|uniref:glutathione transferase n=1 Tax=Schizosaccharomyces cryophilus (strain OY26 / ATCC MYA-4695 / CBS 11777 / NBRC 106824 / NRRL Y48691) TaxID=653667 RepID=S9VR66_SCHCR|nr:glutathione S-transferase Gst2 [Schizosaccharomyces cryophilus OY26]EPY50433.1 glutathione S-transferase Gst2 [Schizosaccharomyces cryophilus OY26]
MYSSNILRKIAQFTLFSHKGSPNPWKVALTLKELNLSYEPVYYDFGKKEQKCKEHLAYNPNGRVPTLVDHKNNDIAIWESDAILAYLTDRYDKERKISLPHDHPEYHHLLQYLFFQSSGQGVIWGQASWFNFYHPEPVTSAITRYRNETKRVLDRDYLVANKCTIADLSFVTWNDLLPAIFGPGKNEFKEELPQLDFEKEFPKTHEWHKRLIERPAVSTALREREELLKQ